MESIGISLHPRQVQSIVEDVIMGHNVVAMAVAQLEKCMINKSGLGAQAGALQKCEHLAYLTFHLQALVSDMGSMLPSSMVTTSSFLMPFLTPVAVPFFSDGASHEGSTTGPTGAASTCTTPRTSQQALQGALPTVATKLRPQAAVFCPSGTSLSFGSSGTSSGVTSGFSTPKSASGSVITCSVLNAAAAPFSGVKGKSG